MVVTGSYTGFSVRSAVRGLLIGLCVVGLSGPAATKVKHKTTYKHYTVKGKSSLDLVLYMGRYGPVVGHERAYGTIHPNPDLEGKLQQRKNYCSTTGFAITFDFLITLPRVYNHKALPRKTRRLFNKFYADTKAHEHVHRKIYLGCARRADKRIRALKKVKLCRQLDDQIGTILKEEFARCEELHKAFDRREAKKLAKEPLIKQALIEARNSRQAKVNEAKVRTIIRNFGSDR